MDHSVAPVLDALAEYQRLDRYGFTPADHAFFSTCGSSLSVKA